MKRVYAVIVSAYLAFCVLFLSTGFVDARKTVVEYNASQAKLVSGLIVENVNVALEQAVAQIEEVSYAIAGGTENDPQVIYEALEDYASRSMVSSIGYIDSSLHVYGQAGDQQDLVNLGYLKQAVIAKETVVTDPFRSRLSAAIVLTVFVPVYKNNRRAGTVFAIFPLEKLQEYANMDHLQGQGTIYLINCHSLNSIACTNGEYTVAGAWNNLALKQARMKFESQKDFQFYIAKMQNGVKGDTVSYEIDGISYTQGYERIEKMRGWYLAVELADHTLSESFQAFRTKLLVYALILLLLTGAMGAILLTLEFMQKKNFEQLSTTDAMIGLYNKKTFTAKVEEYMEKERDAGVLIFVDVDDFKAYNDNYGHLNGDIVLKKFAREMQETFRDHAYVGRYGGDEFVVFVKDSPGRTYVNNCMDELRVKLSAIELDSFGNVPLSFSSGGACYPQDAQSFTDLCNKADEALYCVKKDGKGRYYWYQ